MKVLTNIRQYDALLVLFLAYIARLSAASNVE